MSTLSSQFHDEAKEKATSYILGYLKSKGECRKAIDQTRIVCDVVIDIYRREMDALLEDALNRE